MADELDLPGGPGPIPHAMEPSVDMILEVSEELLPVWNENATREEERLRIKCWVPFVLAE